MCPEPKVCEPCSKCPRCKVCQEDRRQRLMDEAAFDDDDEEDDCPQVPNLTSSLKENPCFPFQYVMTTFDAGGIGNKMSEYATLVAVASMTGYTPGLSEVNVTKHYIIYLNRSKNYFERYCMASSPRRFPTWPNK